MFVDRSYACGHVQLGVDPERVLRTINVVPEVATRTGAASR